MKSESNKICSWYLNSWYGGSSFERTPRSLIKDAADAVYGKNGDSIIVANAWNVDDALFEITRDYEVKWILGKPEFVTTMSVCYCPTEDKLLAYVNDTNGDSPFENPGSNWRIIEVKNGKIKNSLSKTVLGKFAVAFNGAIEYSRKDTNRFWVADTMHHCVYLTDWTGKIHWQLGEYGVAGNDDNHLNYPTSVYPVENEKSLWIGDRNNHRILHVEIKSKSITIRQVHPYPSVRLILFKTLCAFWGNTGELGGSMQHTYLFNEFASQPSLLIPHYTNMVSGHPIDPHRMLVAWEQSMWEYNLNHLAPGWKNPRVNVLWNRQEVASKKPIISPPVVDWYQPNKTLRIKTTRAGVVRIEVARFVDGACNFWDGGWEVEEEMEIKSERLFSYTTFSPFGVFRVKVVLKGTGKITGWVNLE